MKRFLLFLLCVLSLHTNAQSFRELFTEANLLTEDGYYGLAIPIWEILLAEDPDNANLNYKLGSCYLNLGIDRDQALPYLKKAEKNVKRNYDPFSSGFKGAPVETYYYLGKAYHINTDLDSAEYLYKQFLKDASDRHFLRPEAEKGIEMCANAREFMSDPVEVTITNIGTPINSEFAEYSPIIAFDENTLYYTSRRPRTDGSNYGEVEASTGLYFEDMYVSFKNLIGGWMEPELLNINIPNAHSSVVSMSHDGKTLYTYKTFTGNGNIYESHLVIGEGWSDPELVGSDVNTKHNEYFAALTADKRRLYFVSDRPGGIGGKDIWFCNLLPNGEWGKAINIGEPINTPFDEDAPFIHPDGKTMYFSSNGHKSMGGYDIFQSVSANDNWSDPVNLGYPINSTDDDHSFITTPSGERAYYSSKGTGTLGSTDIYIVEFPQAESAPKVDLSAFVVLKGWVLTPDQTTPDDFTILVTNDSSGELVGESTPVARNGSFVFIIPSGADYTVDYTLNEDILLSENIHVDKGEKYIELSREVIISPDKNGKMEAIVLDDRVLGVDKAWQIVAEQGNGLIPIGSKVMYLDRNDEVIHTVYVSKDGFFEFKPLKNSQPFILQAMVPGMEPQEIDIVLKSPDSSPEIDLSLYDGKFMEKSLIPEQEVATKTATVSAAKKRSKSNAISQSSTPEEAGTYAFYFGYNKHDITTSSADYKAMIKAIKVGLNSEKPLSIRIEGSASKVPTSTFDSNQALAEKRTERAKSQLLESLKSAGINVNTISTIETEAKVSGPDYTSATRGKKDLFSDFQYVRFILN